MGSPLVDTNTLIAIDSLFGRSFTSGLRGRLLDPWGKELVGTFSDVYIYEDSFRFTAPHPGEITGDIDIDSLAPGVALELRKRDRSTVHAAIISDNDQKLLKKYYADSTYETFVHSCLSKFEVWAKAYNNKEKLQQWLATQRTKDVRGLWKRQVARKYFFDLEARQLHTALKTLSKTLCIDLPDLCLAFDSVLRVPLYGEKTGQGNYYVFHPQREAWRLAIEQEKSPPPDFPISFAFTFSQIASKLTREEYAILLSETRCLVREWDLIENPPDAHEKPDVLRRLAAKLNLPPRLRKSGPAGTIGTAFLALLAETAPIGHYAALAGSMVAAGTLFLNPYLPRSLCAFKMVRPMLVWDLEDQTLGMKDGKRRGRILRSQGSNKP